MEKLQTGLAGKLTLISAPAGYGKTTLVAAWIPAMVETGQVALGWLSLDEEDNDFMRFFLYLLAALKKAGCALTATKEYLQKASEMPEPQRLMTLLLNEIVQTANGRFLTLVLDDYHKIYLPAIHDALQFWLDHAPPNLHLVLITREDPPLTLPRWRVRGQMTEIRAADLRFSRDEAADFLNRTTGLALTAANIDALEERTEGWIAGLQLAAIALAHIPDDDACQTDITNFITAFSGSHHYIIDYLVDEVLRQQDAGMRRFLQETAVLDRFHAPLCQVITGRVDSQEILQQLEQANLFLVPLDDERRWFRYHHLFADYLRSHLSLQEIAQLRRRAARWCEANNLRFDAVHYALSSGDADFAADVIQRALEQSTTWSIGNVAQFSTWLNALPPHALQNRPQLSLDASRVLFTSGRLGLAEERITQAEKSLQQLPATPERAQMLALATLYRGSIAAVRGDVQQAISQITTAQARLDPENHLAHARAWASLGQAYRIAGQTTQAIQCYLRASDVAQQAGVLYLVVNACCAAARLQIIQGQLHLAEATCQRAVRLAGEDDLPLLGLAWSVLGSIALERNDLPAAATLLKKGVALSRHGRLQDDLTWGLLFTGRLRAVQGDTTGALAAAQEANGIIQAYGVPRMSLRASAYLVRIQHYLGQSAAAREWAVTYQMARTAPFPEFEELTLAHILLTAGELAQLPEILQPIVRQARETGHWQSCLEAMLLLSLYHNAEGEKDTALNWLEQAIHLAAPEGYARIFLDEGKPLIKLLPLARSFAPEWVNKLLDMVSEVEEPDSVDQTQLVEPLSEQEINVLHLICAGLSNREIAAELVISVGTAKWHVHNILQKLGVNSRVQAAARARELGLVS